MNLQRIKRFVNLTPLYTICEKSGGLHQVEPGLREGRRADEIWARFDILKACCRLKFFALLNQGTTLFQHF